MNWYLKVIKNYAGFSGRARRKEYWMFALFNIIFLTIAAILDNIFGTTFKTPSLYGAKASIPYGYIYTLYSLAIFLPGLAVMVRRLHDIGKSGMFILILIGAMFAAAILSGLISLATGGVGSMITFPLLMIAILGVSIWFLVLLCTDSQPGENKYGPNPKDPSQPGTFSGEALDSGIKI